MIIKYGIQSQSISDNIVVNAKYPSINQIDLRIYFLAPAHPVDILIDMRPSQLFKSIITHAIVNGILTSQRMPSIRFISCWILINKESQVATLLGSAATNPNKKNTIETKNQIIPVIGKLSTAIHRRRDADFFLII